MMVAHAQEAPARPTALWYTRCPVPTAFAVAHATGRLEREFAVDGIDVRSLAGSRDPEVRGAHYLHGRPDLFRHGGNIPPLVARSRGVDVRVVALSWTDCALPMLAMPESGIRDAAGLRGRRIALPTRPDEPVDCWRPAILGGVERTLRAAGLTLGDVTLVDIPVRRSFIGEARRAADPAASLWDSGFVLGLQREEVLALVRGDVDAVFSESGMARVICSLTGAVVVTDLATRPDPADRVSLPLPLVVSVSGRLVDEHPDIVDRWLARMIEAAAWAAEHRGATRRILAAEMGIPEDLVDAALTPRAHRQLGIGLDPAHLSALEEQNAFLARHGVIDAPVDLREMVDPGPIRRARALAAAHAA